MDTRRRRLIINETEIHQKTIERYGVNAMINKTIQELMELAEALRDYKIKPANIPSIIEERVDVEKMLNKLDYIFMISDEEKQRISNEKMKRTLERLEPGHSYTLAID